MSSITLKTIASFVILVLSQVFIFNQMNLLGYINPMLYVLFLVHYRFDQNQTLFIFIGFLLGFFIDFMSQTGGAHIIASLSASFFRPFIIRNAFGITAELPKSFQSDSRVLNKIVFLLFFIPLHHLIYFIVVYFSWDAFSLILKSTALTAFFSLLLIVIISSLFKSTK
ncbi:MAG: rod shape-determining protein MreD [Flavobacteriaceae bacterium]|nr:rod shape-determining protein MreD [Flavobacteriaceae bacterium]MDG1911751.1 rod shape-determining protein MreD [Flavobacteriaceae bacterium]